MQERRVSESGYLKTSLMAIASTVERMVLPVDPNFEKDQTNDAENISGCLPKILITQIGHKIDFLQILYVNCTLSGYFKNTFRLGSKCFLQQFTRGVPWWTKMHILLVQKCQFSITLVTPHNT